MDAERGTLTRRTTRSMLWLGMGSGFQAAAQLVVLVVLARLVTPEEFGVVGAALVVVAFCGVFSQVGLGQALVQRSALREAHVRTAFTSSMLLSVALAALVWGTAPAVAAFFQMPTLPPVLRALAAVILLQGLGVVAESLLQRDLRFDVIAWATVASYVGGYGAVGIGTALAGWGVWALVAAHASQVLLRTVIVLAKRPHAVRPQMEREALRDLFSFGFGISLSAMNNQVARKADALVVGRWLGAAPLGLYERAYQFVVMPVALVGQILDRVLFPAMARRQDDPAVLGRVFLRGLSVVALLSAPITAFVLVFSPELVLLLLGPDWMEAVAPFRVLALAIVFRTGSKIADSVVRARGAVYRRAWRQGVYAASVFVGALVGQMWGLPGVAAGVVAALVVNQLLMLHLALGLVSVGWGRVAAVHGPGALLFGAALVTFLAGAVPARGWGLGPAGVLLLGLLPFAALLAVAWRAPFGKRWLADGRWAVDLVRDAFRGRTPAVAEPGAVSGVPAGRP